MSMLVCVPGGMAETPLPSQGCICGSLRSFASNALFGSGWGSEHRSLRRFLSDEVQYR